VFRPGSRSPKRGETRPHLNSITKRQIPFFFFANSHVAAVLPHRYALTQRATNFVAHNNTHMQENPMGFFSKDIKNLDDLFVHTLQDIYYAEKQIEKALPDMIEKATNRELTEGFKLHLEQTKGHIRRVEEVFRMHGHSPKQVDCPAIDGIIEEADDVAGDVADKQTLDAALIAAAQAVEHYEITRYGTLIAWAKQLGRNDCAAVLAENLKEEEATDKKLTQLASKSVNAKAA
jgi:ferritin-like metal-binding protein YciE